MSEGGAVKRSVLARLLGGTVLSQAVISGSSFLVAFIVLRRLGAESYGFYVLVNVTILLLVGLQSAFFLTPAVVSLLSNTNLRDRPSVVGGLMRARRISVFWLSGAALPLTALAWSAGLLPPDLVWLVLAGIFAGTLMLWREFCRSILIAYHRTGDILRGDIAYILLWIGGSVAASYLPMATPLVVACIGLASWISGSLMSRAIWRFEPWDPNGSTQALRDAAPQGLWATFGSVIHWSFSQGYTYMAAAMLDVRAVAALAATRLFLMPVNLLSVGVGQSMYPIISSWNSSVSLNTLIRRVTIICAILAGASVVYAAMVWWWQDWLFSIVNQNFDQAGLLLLLWSMVFVLMLLRDQIGLIVFVRVNLKILGQLTLYSAGAALVTIWLAIPVFGPAGALLGILVGEALNFLGLLVLLFWEARRDRGKVGR